MKHLIVSKKMDSCGRIRLDKKDYNYLVSVRRLKKGQKLSLLLEGARPALAEIIEINSKKKYLELKVLDEKVEGLLSSAEGIEFTKCVEIVLLQWLIKGQHMDLAVRQLTEAGVSAIFSVLGEFSAVKKESSGQFERRQRIIREARQQSGSFVETKLFPAKKLEEVLLNVREHSENKHTACFMLTEKRLGEAETNKKKFLSVLKEKPEMVVLAIGCEGGISPSEKQVLMANDFKAIHFETNVLRAETAAIYSVATVQAITQML